MTLSTFFGIFFLVSSVSFAGVPPAAKSKHEAGTSKTGEYVNSGFFIGGSKTVTAAHLKDIRRGPQTGGVERLVFDLESSGEGKEQVPFFQLNVNPDEGRLILSIWADVTYDFDVDKIGKVFSKSGHIKKVGIMPRVEEGVATIELTLKKPDSIKVEAFHLAHPSRIILDLL